MRLVLLLASLILCTRWAPRTEVAAYQRATRPNLTNLTAEEAHLAEVYWAYRVYDRVVRPPGERGPRPGRADLSYAFITPLPERLAGIGYVGHAARLRLLVERVRRGSAIRVGALGGSITFGQGAGGPEFTYAAQFVEWLNAALPPDRPGRFTELPAPYWSGSSSYGISSGGSSSSSTADGSSSDGSSKAEGRRRLASSAAPEAVAATAGTEAEAEAATAAAAAAAAAAGSVQQDGLRRLMQSAAALAAGGRAGGRGSGRGRRGGRRRGGADLNGGLLVGGAAGRQGATAAAAAVAAASGTDVRAAGMTALEEEEEGLGTGSSSGSSNIGDAASGGADSAAAAAAGAAAAGRVPYRRYRHHYMSGAVPGTQSGYMSSCLQHHLPRDADLVLLDYAVNDPPQPSHAFDDPHRRAFERLLRKALSWPSRPAVVLVNMFAAGAARGRYYYNAERDFSELASYYGVPAVSLKAALVPAYSAAAVAAAAGRAAAVAATAGSAATTPRRSSSSGSSSSGGAGLLRGSANNGTTSTTTTTTTAVAAAQAAAWRLRLPATAVGYAPGSSSATAARQTAALGNASLPVLLPAVFNGGKHHPGRGGHVVAAELLISLVLELLRSNEHLTELMDGPDVALLGNTTSTSTSTSTSRGNSTSTSTSTSRGNSSASSSASSNNAGAPAAERGSGPVLRGLGPAAAAALEELAARPLPPPLAEGNYEAAVTTCYIEHELSAIVQRPATGWNYTDEGRGKWGWVALEPGRQLRIKLNTLLPGERAAAAPGTRGLIVVQIAYLQSYSGMGAARVTCESGCVCEAAAAAQGGLEVDGHDPRPVSVTSIADLRVSQHPECVLLITTLGPGRNAKRAKRPAAGAAAGGGSGMPGDKFKLMGVVVGEEPGAAAGTVNWVRPESHESAQLMRLMANQTGNFSMTNHY
ncbi:hypothetical protein HYH02_008587 [Chlamydomonas schloesseri]|uniref:SGNH hydrolase-type esterase domain-containing protein n=1 Tax=Chlamydomonas schloesseri TaxID=2026947 RepID=A0A836B3L0_9CHLO|nr:hypothetical protein HYH02_008587 [Chlamydomonas schloesseri]|eukprot:KAG2446602.1 hypothetical protein HYH02_008587 [Chlamydomonas schloesseri]